MTRDFCDRCGSEVTGKPYSDLGGQPDVTKDTKVTDNFILCRACYRAWLKWMAAAKKQAK